MAAARVMSRVSVPTRMRALLPPTQTSQRHPADVVPRAFTIGNTHRRATVGPG